MISVKKNLKKIFFFAVVLTPLFAFAAVWTPGQPIVPCGGSGGVSGEIASPEDKACDFNGFTRSNLQVQDRKLIGNLRMSDAQLLTDLH